MIIQEDIARLRAEVKGINLRVSTLEDWMRNDIEANIEDIKRRLEALEEWVKKCSEQYPPI